MSPRPAASAPVAFERLSRARDEDASGLAAIGAGLLAWAGCLFPVLLDEHFRMSMPAPFWVGMLAYPVVFGAQVFVAGRGEGLLTAVQVLLGLGLVFLVPDYTMMPVLLVVGVVAAAYQLTLRQTLLLVAVQTAAVWVASSIGSAGNAGYGWIAALVYAGLQLFAVVMVDAQRKEAQARKALDVLNAELQERNDELARAQHRLAAASRSAERLRISRDLHDTVGHQLTALALHLEAAAHLASGTAAEEPVAGSRDMARSLLGDVRRVVGQLRDEPPGGTDLGGALHRLAVSVPRPVVRLRLDENMPTLSAEQVEAVLRGVQECITNAARHSDSATLTIDVFHEDDEVLVRAVDDGRGALRLREGNGLTGMRERFAALDGLVTVRTAPGQGFRVVARFPVGPDAAPGTLAPESSSVRPPESSSERPPSPGPPRAPANVGDPA